MPRKNRPAPARRPPRKVVRPAEAAPPAIMADWTITTDWRYNGRHVVPGTELSITGERGRFRFVKHVRREAAGIEWVDVHGGPANQECYRSFRPERIKTVHRTVTPKPGARHRK